MSDAFLRIAAALTGVVFAIAALSALGFIAIVLAERIRRWRADRLGFGDFIDAGAPLEHDRLVSAFDHPGTHDDGAEVSIVQMGDILITDGTIIVQDPAHLMFETETPTPFDEAFPIGRFPVDALVLTESGDQRIAAVRIAFSQNHGTALSPAFTNEWRAALAKTRRELPWFGIDSATAAIGTAASFGWLAERLAADPENTEGLAPGTPDGTNPYLSNNPADLYTTPASGEHALFVVLSGLGDGTGQCLIERDDANRITALYVDFGMLGAPRWIRPDRAQAA
ncbi:MAG: DUF4241 domain-containing protein [Planctomycetota bacterium]